MVDYPATAEAEFLAQQGYDASDEQAVNNARSKEGRERRAELEFVKAIMDLKEGRKWMFNLIASCNPLGNPIVPGDTHYTYHNIGGQNVGKKLLQDVNEAAPTQYTLMMQESRES